MTKTIHRVIITVYNHKYTRIAKFSERSLVMNVIKKLTVLLLGTFVASVLFTAVNAYAGTGPNSSDTSCAYVVVMNGSEQLYVFDGVSSAYKPDGYVAPGYTQTDITYDRKSNTLTFNNCNATQVVANEMGDDFCIRLVGNNTVQNLQVWGYYYGGSVHFKGSGTLDTKTICLHAEESEAVFTVSDTATVTITAEVSTQDSPAFGIIDTKAGKNAVKAKCDRKIETIEIPFLKTEAVDTGDGFYEYYPLLTKDGKTYCVKTFSSYSQGKLAPTRYEVYSFDGSRKTVASFDTEKAMLKAGYEFVTDGYVYSFICDTTRKITFTPDESADAKSDDDVKAVKGDILTIDDAKYKITKEGTAKTAGTLAFTSPKFGETTVVIPSSVTVNGINYNVTSIAAGAFSGNTAVKELTIGKNVKTIGKKAFFKCSSLTSIKINTTKLTKTSVKANSFKGVSGKCVIETPPSKTESYRKILVKAGLNTKATVE